MKFYENTIIELNKAFIKEFNKADFYKLCSKDKFISINKDRTIVYYSTINSGIKLLTFKHTNNIKLISCDKTHAFFKDESRLISLNLTSLASSTKSYFSKDKNIYINKKMEIIETIDKDFNLDYKINNNMTKFPKGFPQLKVTQSEGLSSSLNIKDKMNHVILTNATSKVTDLIVSDKSLLLVLFSEFEVKAYLQLSKNWQLKNKIQFKNILDLKLKNDNSVSLLYRDESNLYRIANIPFINFNTEGINGK